MSAARLLREAEAAGVRLRLAQGGAVKAAGTVSLELLARLRAQKAGLVAILRGDACRWCGAAVAKPDGMTLGDHTIGHYTCYVADTMRRAEQALAPLPADDGGVDDAELMVRGEPLP